MNKRIASSLSTLLAGLLGLAPLPTLPALAAFQAKVAQGYGPGSMIGPGMMNGGMIGQPSGNQTAPSAPATTDQAKALVGYIHDQKLGCLQCHDLVGGGMVPSFDTVSTRYAGRSDAKPLLENHIAHGVGEMPPDMATEAQASRLTDLILGLNPRQPGQAATPND